VAATLAATKFAGCPIVAVAARPGAAAGGGEGGGGGAALDSGLRQLVDVLVSRVQIRQERAAQPFLFNIDHCFAVKGQGTVLTGARPLQSAALAWHAQAAPLRLLHHGVHPRHFMPLRPPPRRHRGRRLRQRGRHD
jgi:selenocysteine-specific elongation factor